MKHLGTRSRLGTTLVLAVLVALFTALPGSAATAATSHGQSPIVAKNKAGTMRSYVTGTTSDGRTVRGTFTPSSFSVVNGVLTAAGTLEGTIRGHGKALRFDQPLTTPVTGINGTALPTSGSTTAMRTALASAATSGACNVLNLDLGPLDLDLLGLKVHLNEVVLDITAQPGPGNLLGNLLCSVAGLLDGGSPLSGLLGQVSTLLNQLLGGLGL